MFRSKLFLAVLDASHALSIPWFSDPNPQTLNPTKYGIALIFLGMGSFPDDRIPSTLNAKSANLASEVTSVGFRVTQTRLALVSKTMTRVWGEWTRQNSFGDIRTPLETYIRGQKQPDDLERHSRSKSPKESPQVRRDKGHRRSEGHSFWDPTP